MQLSLQIPLQEDRGESVAATNTASIRLFSLNTMCTMPYYLPDDKAFFIPILLLFAAASCQKKEHAGERQAIAINFSYSPFTADPRKCTDPVTTTLNFMLYEGLTHLEADGTVSYALAERVKISRDKRNYLFFLRPAMWSDGSPLTAYHFEAAWKAALSPDFTSKSAHLLFPIKNAERAKNGECSLDEVGIEALDEKTLMVRLERPTPYFLELISFCL